MIIALEDAKYKLIAMRADIKDLGSALSIDELRQLAKELDEQTLDPDFWSNQENSSSVLQKLKQTKDTIENYEPVKQLVLISLALCPTSYHSIEHLCPILRFSAACSRVEGNDGVVLIVLTRQKYFYSLALGSLGNLVKLALNLVNVRLVVFLNSPFRKGYSVFKS